MRCARNLPRVFPHKPWLLVIALILAGCGGGSGGKAQTVVGDGFRFEAPSGWNVEHEAGLVRAADGRVDLVSVRTFKLVKRYRPALFDAASRELDGVAAQLATELHGTLAATDTVRVAGRDARSYRIDYDGKAQEITFVLDGRREYQLLCRRDDHGSRGACKRLVRSFALG